MIKIIAEIPEEKLVLLISGIGATRWPFGEKQNWAHASHCTPE